MDPLPRKPASARPPLSTRVGRACFFPQNFLPVAPGAGIGTCLSDPLPRKPASARPAPLNEGRARLLLPAKLSLPIRPVPRQGPAFRKRRGSPLNPLPGKPASSRQPLPAKLSAVPMLGQELLLGENIEKKRKADFAPFRVANPLFRKFCFSLFLSLAHVIALFFGLSLLAAEIFLGLGKIAGETVRPHPCRPSGTC